MEDDPSSHDFDQRHDGPLQRPSIQIERPEQSLSDVAPQGPSSPTSLKAFASPKSAEVDVHDPLQPGPPRKSVQIARQPLEQTQNNSQTKRVDSDEDGIVSPGGRKSTQINRSGRPSRDFDVRRDGPYGRPSLNISRRRSSAHSATSPSMIPGPDVGTHNASISNLDGVDIAKEQLERGRSLPDHPLAAGVEEAEPAISARDAAFEPEPPPLNYSLRDRKVYIFGFWLLILADCIAMPLALYYGLWYHTDLSPNAVFSIVTAGLGGVSIFEYFVRLWRLVKRDSKCRVIGARRLYLDWFHWNFTFGWVVVMIELIVGTVPEHPPIRLLSMPVASMLYVFAAELLIVDTLRYFEVPAPVRISSIPKGSQLRPGIYSLIEDICAVDGSGGTAYREALNKRYEASHVFRVMLRRLGAFWAFGAAATAILVTVLIFTLEPETAYIIGWTVPFGWAGVWTLLTFVFVKHMLKKEKQAWKEEVEEKLGQVASA